MRDFIGDISISGRNIQWAGAYCHTVGKISYEAYKNAEEMLQGVGIIFLMEDPQFHKLFLNCASTAP